MTKKSVSPSLVNCCLFDTINVSSDDTWRRGCGSDNPACISNIMEQKTCSSTRLKCLSLLVSALCCCCFLTYPSTTDYCSSPLNSSNIFFLFTSYKTCSWWLLKITTRRHSPLETFTEGFWLLSSMYSGWWIHILVWHHYFYFEAKFLWLSGRF